jgi:succinoglycan biosynthesis transport protein ExoP
MTLRQVLEILWQRKLLVIATLILAVAAAVAYMEYSVKTYESSAIVKLNGAATASSDTDSNYAGIELDTDTDAITSMSVLGPAAQDLGETDIPALTASLKIDVTEGVRTNKINIHAVGTSPAQAQARSNAVASAYVDYLSNQVELGRQRLMDDKASAAKEVRRLQNQLDHDKHNSVLITYQEQAIARLGQIQGQLDQVEMAGKPAVVQKQATLGRSTSIAPMTILGIGLLSGILAGAGVALIREQFDERLHNSRETEAATGEPILAEVAVDRGRRKKDMSLPAATNRATAFTESIRTLRTSLQVLAPPSRAVVAITSPEPGDGKSFVTANLAVSMSLAGRSVIVVGGDLRQGRIGHYFGARADTKGFAEAIASDADTDALRALLCPTEHEGLMLLPPGSTKAEPADLLATDSLRRVISRLRDMADMVLIDTPPALALADAAIIAGHADGVIVLSNVGRTQRETLVGTLRVLRANAGHVYGVVSNRSRRSMPKTYQEYLGAAAGWELQLPAQTHTGSDDAQLSGRRAFHGDRATAEIEQQISTVSSEVAAENLSAGNEQVDVVEADSIGPEQRPADAILHEEPRAVIETQPAESEQSAQAEESLFKAQMPDHTTGFDSDQPVDENKFSDLEEVREPQPVPEPEQEEKTVNGWDLYILEYPPLNGEPAAAMEGQQSHWSWDWDLDDLGIQPASPEVRQDERPVHLEAEAS